MTYITKLLFIFLTVVCSFLKINSLKYFLLKIVLSYMDFFTKVKP